jgi:tripartite ATP-independent transporter DctP family solute receptor
MNARMIAVALSLAAAPLTGISGVAVSAAAAADMKIAHAVPPGAPRDLGSNLVADMVNKDARCDLDAKVYPGGQLGDTTVLIENLQLGALEMAVMPASFLVGFQPLVGIMDFPYFWPNTREELEKLHKTPAMRALLDTTEEKGVHTLAVWHTGYKSWTADKPLDTFEAYKGLKARVMPSKVLVRQDELLGVTPISMPFSETYTALQTKAIDAQENPIVTSFFMKFYEVQDYMTITNHGTLDQLVMLSKSWWDGLPADCQTAVTEAVAAGGTLTADKTYELIAKAEVAFEKAGMKLVPFTSEAFAEAKAKVLPGIEAFYVEENGPKGKEILDGFKKQLGTM